MTLVPALQPIVLGSTTEVLAYEALARWRLNGRVLTPAEMPEAPLWQLVDREMIAAIHKNSPWMANVPRLFVNVGESTVESQPAFDAWLAQMETLAHAAPYSIVIEITEGISDGALRRAWPHFRQLGLKLALDDFGDGSSSRARLLHYDWDYCKFESHTAHETSTQSALDYCKVSGILPIVEKVDSKENSQSFEKMGLHWQQGYLHGKPKLLCNPDPSTQDQYHTNEAMA